MMDNLKLYSIDNEYIEYLEQCDDHVLYAKGAEYINERKYLGAVLEVNGFKYFAPLSSPKSSDYYIRDGKHVPRKSIIPIVRLLNRKGRLLAKIKLSSMIPVPDQCLKVYDVENEADEKYRDLIKDEIISIRKNRNEIMRNARVLYNQKTNNYDEINYLKSTIDFKKAEDFCNTYINNAKQG
ncbi:MAG: type III toxin-antitoxin system ToxN/AbiQ family toxin [bacterium]|nr:type III toxin-antitoxin system ToxN/AbiQ family toxin [bacterium]